MLQKNHNDDKELLTAQVSYVNAPHISPHHRGKRAVLVALHKDHFLWAEDGDTVGFIQICSHENEMVDLIYVPEKFVGRELGSDDHYLLKYLCPASGKTVQQEMMQVVARTSHRGVKGDGFALGCLARFFVSRLINDSLRAIRKARCPGYFDVVTGNNWFDAPIKRHHLRVRTVNDLRRAGLLISSVEHAANGLPPRPTNVK
jgi:hypothetical protein